jgi:hypothetical protein
MTTIPNTWVEEDREEVVSTIVDGIISTMTLEEMRKIVWDSIYEDLVWQSWADLWDKAEEYAPDLLDAFKIDSAPSY